MILRALLIVLALASSSQAATYYVAATGGDNSRSCATAQTIGTPKLTINNALTCLSAGDTLNIRVGTYAESVSMANLAAGGTSGNPITIQSYQNEAVIIRPSSGNVIHFGVARNYVTWKGSAGALMVIDGGGVAASALAYGIEFGVLGSTGNIFQYLDVKNAGQNGISCSGIDMQILNSKFHDNGRSYTGGFYPSPNNGIYCGSVTNAVIADNESYNNPGFGFRAHSAGTGSGNIIERNRAYNNGEGGVVVADTNMTVRNNLIYNNTSFGIEITADAASSSGHNIYNNTISGHTFGIYTFIYDTSNVTIQNNIIFNSTVAHFFTEVGGTHTSLTRSFQLCYSVPLGTTTPCEFGTNNLNANPRFADAPNGDFRLCIEAANPHPNCTVVSPAIDATSIATATDDFAGTARPIGPTWDIGGFEAGLTVPPEPTPTLVAEISCDNTVVDSSGNANHGTLTNGATHSASGKYGAACSFDGTDDYVNVADSASLDLTHGFTLSAWVFPTSAMTDFKAIMVKNYVYYLYGASSGYCAAGGILAGYDTGGGSVNACYDTALTPNTWTHLSATYNRTSVVLYVNGVPVTSAAGSAFMPVTSGALQIGASGFAGEYFAGLVDEVRIHNYALTATEVVTAMNTRINPSVPNTVTVKMAGTTMKFAGTAVKFGSTTAAVASYILLENGDNLLKEDGDDVLSEQ
jgi:parallel beta-helix repeat protein